MAEITLLHQEILMLKLRVTALEDQKKDLINSLSIRTAEYMKSQDETKAVQEQLKNTEKAYLTSQSFWAKKVEQLESALEDQFTDSDVD